MGVPFLPRDPKDMAQSWPRRLSIQDASWRPVAAVLPAGKEGRPRSQLPRTVCRNGCGLCCSQRAACVSRAEPPAGRGTLWKVRAEPGNATVPPRWPLLDDPSARRRQGDAGWRRPGSWMCAAGQEVLPCPPALTPGAPLPTRGINPDTVPKGPLGGSVG